MHSPTAAGRPWPGLSAERGICPGEATINTSAHTDREAILVIEDPFEVVDRRRSLAEAGREPASTSPRK